MDVVVRAQAVEKQDADRDDRTGDAVPRRLPRGAARVARPCLRYRPAVWRRAWQHNWQRRSARLGAGSLRQLHADTWKTTFSRSLPASLTLAMQPDSFSAVMGWPHISRTTRVDAGRRVLLCCDCAPPIGGLKLPAGASGTAPTDLQDGAKLPTVLSNRNSRKNGHPYQSPWVGCDGWLH